MSWTGPKYWRLRLTVVLQDKSSTFPEYTSPSTSSSAPDYNLALTESGMGKVRIRVEFGTPIQTNEVSELPRGNTSSGRETTEPINPKHTSYTHTAFHNPVNLLYQRFLTVRIQG